MRRVERSANHSMASTATIMSVAISRARCVSEPYSSSAMGTVPVSRTRTPCCGSSLSFAAVSRMACVARCAGHQRLEIEIGPDFDEPSRFAQTGLRARHHRAPRKVSGLACEHVVERIGEARHRPVEIGEFRLAVLHAQKRGREIVGDAAKARIDRQRTQEGLRRDQLLHRVLHLGRRQKHQAVMGEELAVVRLADGRKQRLVRRQRRREIVGGRVRALGRHAVDDGDDQPALLRELLVVDGFALAPLRLRRDQLFRPAVHRKVPAHVVAGREGQQQRRKHDETGIAAAESHYPDDKCCPHSRIHLDVGKVLEIGLAAVDFRIAMLPVKAAHRGIKIDRRPL